MNDVPSSTLPARVVTFARSSSESASDVFPSPPCPTKAKVRVWDTSAVMISSSGGLLGRVALEQDT